MGKHGTVKEATRPLDVKKRRERVRRGGEDGSMSLGDRANADTVIKLLNEALAMEIICGRHYKRHYFLAAGLRPFSAKTEFLHHAMEEQAHADQLIKRIIQLGGEPNVSPEAFLNRRHLDYTEGESLREVIMEDLNGKRTAINSYRRMIAFVSTDDPKTHKLLGEILSQEEEQAGDRESLLKILGPELKARFPGR